MSAMSENWPIYFREMLYVKNKNHHVCIVTLWSKKEIYIEKLKTDYNTIGQLYSREEGLSALVRNLLANKKIRDIILVGVDLNHCSEAIINLFENGVNDKNEVICDYYSKIDEEIPKKAINELRKNVKLHDLRKIKDYNEIVKYIDSIENKSEWGKYEIFEEHKLNIPEIFPSDNAVFKVRKEYIKDAWIEIIKIIDKFGVVKKSQYGDKQKEVINLTTVITKEEPDNPKLIDDFDFNINDLESYIPQVTSPKKFEGLDYTYGNLLFDYKGINQIDNIIKQLKNESYTRRAVAVTWNVEKDHKNSNPPCLDLVQCLVQENKLYFTCYFRSNDMFGAWPRNAFALRKLQKDIAKECSFKIGHLIIISNSAHIYERHFNKIPEIIKKYKKKVVWEKDPFGNIIIRVINNKIVVEHLDAEGRRIDVIEGKTAIEICKKIANNHKISDIGHALDIGCELQKAEIALKRNLKYIQDKSLEFD